MSQTVVPRSYQISPSTDALINGLFEGLAEPRLTRPIFSWVEVLAAASRRDINTDYGFFFSQVCSFL